ncbi:MAG: hypothetical protein ACLVK8_05735 [Ruminococcus sp.]
MERRLLFHGIQESAAPVAHPATTRIHGVALRRTARNSRACIGAALVYNGSHQTRLGATSWTGAYGNGFTPICSAGN